MTSGTHPLLQLADEYSKHGDADARKRLYAAILNAEREALEAEKAAVAAEREACAKACEAIDPFLNPNDYIGCAEAIRARGQP